MTIFMTYKYHTNNYIIWNITWNIIIECLNTFKGTDVIELLNNITLQSLIELHFAL